MVFGVCQIYFYLRFIDLKKLSNLSFSMILKNKKYQIRVVDLKKQRYKFERIWKDVIFLKLESFKDGKRKKKGTFELIFSNDPRRVLYAIKGYLKMGHLEGRLLEYERN